MTSSVSTFSILSPRGDTIISREFREDTGTVHACAEKFFRAAKFGVAAVASSLVKQVADGPTASSGSSEEAPPVFELEGVTFCSIKVTGLYFVSTTRFNASANQILELLARLAKSFRDFCGVLTEEAIRKNFVLVYELLDEVIDYGFPQTTSTESLKMFVYNEPVPVAIQPSAASAVGAGLTFKMPGLTDSASFGRSRMAPSSSVNKSVLSTGGAPSQTGLGAMGLQRFASATSASRNEIFVDILERVTCLFSASGAVINSEVDGSIVMKSFLHNNPELRVALNEDLILGKQNLASFSAGVILDDANFHECVRLDEFEEFRSLVFVPPEGEFVLMNYRMTSDVRPPFRITPTLEQVSPTQYDLTVRVSAVIPARNYGSNVKVKFPVPKAASGVSLNVGRGSEAMGQSAEYLPQDHRVLWTLRKLQGGTEQTLRARVTLREPLQLNAVRREMGPVSMEFEIPMLSISNLQVRYLRVANPARGEQAPHRWVRYIMQSHSYACRLT